MRTPLPVDDLPVGCGISAAEFAALTCYCNASDNGPDDERRARLLGFGNGVKVAPGAIIRIGDNEIGENSFIGLYAYLNGDVRIGRNVLIGPHCSLPAGNHRFDPATQAFTPSWRAYAPRRLHGVSNQSANPESRRGTGWASYRRPGPTGSGRRRA